MTPVLVLRYAIASMGLLLLGQHVTVVHGYGGKPRPPPPSSSAASAGSLTVAKNGGGCHRRAIWQSGLVVMTALLPLPSWALSPEEAASAYNTYASTYDALDAGPAASVLGIEEARTSLFSQASGNVLEIGAGTGLNLYRYNPSLVTSLTLLDISWGMLQQAQERLQDDPLLQRQWKDIPIQWVQADATTELVSTFGRATFDTVVDSFSLCVMGKDGAKQCLDQLRQVVKPQPASGKLLLLENSRSTNPLLAKYQDVTATTAALAGGKGCVYNQDVRAMLDATQGIVVEKEVAFAAGLFRSFECSVQSS